MWCRPRGPAHLAHRHHARRDAARQRDHGNVQRVLGAISRLGLLYVHVIEEAIQESRDAPDGISFPTLHRRFTGTNIADSQYTLERADATLKRGDADLFSFGRAFLANPDFVDRIWTGAPLAGAPERYWYVGRGLGCADWPGMAEAVPALPDRE